MEAPEKIYIDVSLDSAWGMSERSYDNEVEYTRTDAFIEKACEWIKSHGGFTLGFDGATVKDFMEHMKK